MDAQSPLPGSLLEKEKIAKLEKKKVDFLARLARR
jgi:hypothetical protein